MVEEKASALVHQDEAVGSQQGQKEYVEGAKPSSSGFESSAPIDLMDYYRFVQQMEAKKLIKRPIYPSVLLDLAEIRDRVKVEMKRCKKESTEFMAKNILQASVKLIMVSSYGVAGMHADEKHPHLRSVRFFDADFFNSVTTTSQDVVKLTMSLAKLGVLVKVLSQPINLDVLYGDTDSVFLKIRNKDVSVIDVALVAADVAGALDEKVRKILICKFHLDESQYHVLLEPKNVYEALILTAAKKKYRGEVVWSEGEFGRHTDLMGFESKRSDAFPLMARMQEGCQKILIDSPMDWELIERLLVAYYQEIEKQMFAGSLDKELIQEKTVKKTSLDEYGTADGKGIPPHVRAAKQLFAIGALRMGDRVGYVVVDQKDGKQVVTAIDPRSPEKIPEISVAGYQYYRGRLLEMLQRLVGRAYNEMLNTKMDRWFESGEDELAGS